MGGQCGSLFFIQTTIHNIYSVADLLSSPSCACVVCLCAYARGSQLDIVEVLLFRDRTLQGSRSIQHSVIFQVKLPELPNNSGKRFLHTYLDVHKMLYYVYLCDDGAQHVCTFVLVHLNAYCHTTPIIYA